MKLCDIEVSDDNAMSFHLVDDLSDTEVRLGDYIRLKGLQVGQILYLKDDGSGQKIIFVGNGTPHEGVSSISRDGWYWKLWNHWTVNRVFQLAPELNGSFLAPGSVEMVLPEKVANA